MKLTCKIGRNDTRVDEVQPENELNILLEKLKVDKRSKFVYKGFTYLLACTFTFQEIQLTTDARINIITPARAGTSK